MLYPLFSGTITMVLSDEIDAIVADAIERHVFPGAVVLIAADGAICHYAAYGSTMYGAPASQPVERATIYDIASLTKMFTATAALRLIDRGALELHAPVAAYLPAFRAPDVTIRHLLTHTSGLDIRLSTLRQAGRSGLLAAVYDTRPARSPGSVVAYTNVNSLLLGEVVALLHGQPLDRALDELVIAPLGLRDTLFRPPARLLPRIAPTEIDEMWRGTLVHGGVHDESAHALGGVAGHAGLFSTAEDLWVFCRMWLSSILDFGFGILDYEDRSKTQNPKSKMLSSEIARLATTNHTAELGFGCGLGWMIDRPNFMGRAPAGTFGHTGFTGPAIAVVPGYRLIVIVLSNRVYPRRGPATHHTITAAILGSALRAAAYSGLHND